MSRKISRREMLKQSTLWGAGALILTNGILAKGASPNEKMNLAFVGIGGQGGFSVNNLKSENYVALCDVDEVRAGKTWENFPAAKRYADFRVMFDEMSEKIDGVIVATPDHMHYHPTIQALRLGKHVYCEKPLAHSVAECRIVTQTAKEKKLATQLGAQRHAYPNMHRVVEIIQSGAIGEVNECHVWVGGSRGMPAFPTKFPEVRSTLNWDLWLGPAKKRPYALNEDGSDAYAPYNWRFFWDFGTGETGNWACHLLDIAYWALELAHPTHVSATGPEVDAERTPKGMAVTYQYPERKSSNGTTLPPVKLLWEHAVTPTCRALLPKDYQGFPGSGCMFFGSKGKLLASFDKHWPILTAEEAKDFKRPEPFIPNSPGFHREWVNACKGGIPATVNFDYSGPMAEAALLGNNAFRAGHKSFDWNAETLTAVDCPEVQALIKPEFFNGFTY